MKKLIIWLVLLTITIISYSEWRNNDKLKNIDGVKVEAVEKYQYKVGRGRDVFEVYYKIKENNKIYSRQYSPYEYDKINIGEIYTLDKVPREYVDFKYKKDKVWGIILCISAILTFVTGIGFVTWTIEDNIKYY